MQLIMVCILGTLAACGSNNTPTLQPTAIIAPTATTLQLANTPTPEIIPTATPNHPRYGAGGLLPEELVNPTVQAVLTIASQQLAAHQTAVALTPRPPTATWIPQTPEPTPTIGVGMVADTGCTFPRYFRGPEFPSCWYTNINGAWILVGSGHEGTSEDDIAHGAAGPADLHGLIWVCPEPCWAPEPDHLYPAPRPDLHIIAVDGPRITLASRDPTVPDTFVFDITTRQWVPPAPSPVPSLPPTP
jgi:hypothetical protein